MRDFPSARTSLAAPPFPLFVAGALGVAASLLFAAPARAYCREVTLDPPIGYDPTTSGCFTQNPDGGGPLPPLFWRNQCVGYSFQRNGSSQFTLAQAEAVATQAFAAWGNAACPGGGSPSISATELFPPVDCDTVPSQEHNNVIIFRDSGWPYPYDPTNAIGLTTLSVDTTTGEILGADIEINTKDFTIVPTDNPPPGDYDLASILTHEAGHFLGLAHSADSTAVMYAYYHPGSTTLQPDDVAGICSIYDPTGPRNAQSGPLAAMTCNPAPLLGFQDECGVVDGGPTVSTSNPTVTGAEGIPCSDSLTGCAIGVPSGATSTGFAAAGLLGAAAVMAGGRRRKGRRASGGGA